MMFGVRGVMVALAFFGVLYCLLSLLVVCVWGCTSRLRRDSAIGTAGPLFALRVFPLVGSAVITLAFAVPAFVLLEPAVIDEDIGTLVFCVGTLLLLAAGAFRITAAHARTSRVAADWLEGADILDTGAAVPTLQAKRGLPPLLLYGVSAPKVLVSEAAVELLSRNELRVAVQHEIGHLRSRDNLKKLVLYGAPFPGMAGLERAWQEAAEFAADEAAISNDGDAVDLATALVKLCDLVPVQVPPAFTTGLVNLSSLVKPRVQRLLAWNEAGSHSARRYWRYFLPLVVIFAGYVCAHYGQALLFTHRATEWFIG
jgi:Zn-dependent protease with chaperone function